MIRNISVIEPLVGWVECRHGDIHHAKFTDGPVTAPRPNEDCRHWFDWEYFSVKFHVTMALDDKVDLGQSLVIMNPRVHGNIHQVQTRYLTVTKRAACRPAWTRDGFNGVKLSNHVVRQ
jgi:hypothetical protein